MTPLDHPEVATTALHAPDGVAPARVDVDQHLPASWPRDYVEHLVATRGARVPAADEVLDPRPGATAVVDAAVPVQ